MTEALPFTDDETVRVRALYIGERIDLRAFESSSKFAVLPLTVAAGARGVAVLFRYGAIVLYNVAPIEEAALRNDLDALVTQRFDEPEIEEAALRIDPGQLERGHDSVITLRTYDVDRLQLVADVMAKSVVLAHYEQTIAQAFDAIEPLAADLNRTGASGRTGKELLKHIGGTLLIQTRTVWRVEVTDKPDILWERPDLEILYSRLVDEYELAERHLALDRKLELIARTATTALELVQHRRSLRVEWYIVILIVIDIVISLLEKLTG